MKYRYPLTLAMLNQSTLDVVARLAMLGAVAGNRDLPSKIAVTTQLVTVLEQFVRLLVEEALDKKRGRRAFELTTVRGLCGRIRVSISKARALRRNYQSVGAIEKAAQIHDMEELLSLVRRAAGPLGAMVRARHDNVHALGTIKPGVAAWHKAVEGVVFGVIARRPPALAAAHAVKGNALEAGGRPGLARAAYEESLEVCRAEIDARRGSAWLYTCAGYALAHIGRMDEARSCYGKAVDADPGSATAFHCMANLEMESGRYVDAVPLYEKAADLDGSLAASARSCMGYAAVLSGDGGAWRALEDINAVMRLNPKDASLRAGYGLALAMAGRRSEAGEMYRQAIGADPGDAAAHAGLADDRAFGGEYPEAVRLYRKAIGLGFSGYTAQLGMADALSKTGQHAKAVDHYRAAALSWAAAATLDSTCSGPMAPTRMPSPRIGGASAQWRRAPRQRSQRPHQTASP